MQYAIVQRGMGSKASISISKKDYDQIDIARNTILEAVFIEQKYDLMLENYFEYEVSQVECSSRTMIFSDLTWSKFNTDLLMLNRRVINLLTTCRLYFDQVTHHLNKLDYENKGYVDSFESARATEYDENLHYRIMEALRNYAQHRGMPVNYLRHEGKRIGMIDDYELLHSLTPSLDQSLLRNDKEFKKEILKEMTDLPDKIDLKPIIRSYIDSISKVQNVVRTILKEALIKQEYVFKRWIDEFAKEYPAEELWIAAVKMGESGTWSHPIPVFTEIIEYRKILAQKNRTPSKFSKSFVTTQVIDNSHQ